MAEDFILEESEAPSRFERALKIFIAIAILALAGELIWLLGISPFRNFNKIEISGYNGIPRSEILAIAGLSESSSFFSTNAAAIEKALMKISSISSVSVLKHFPGRLQIVLESRQPLASSLAIVNGQTVTVVFDSKGVIFETGVSELSVTLPLVSGLVIEDPYPGMKLPSIFTPFFAELEKISQHSPELLNAISEIKITRKPFNGFDLLLFPVHKKIKVRMSELNEDLLRYALLMIDVLSSREEAIDTLDFRSGIASYVSYNSKEAYSE